MSNRSTKVENRKMFAPSEIVLITILGLLLCITILASVLSCVAVSMHTSNIFSKNMIKTFVYSLVSAVVLYVVGFGIKNERINLKDWLIIAFYMSIFVLVNVYNVFDLYDILVLNILAQLVQGVMYAIIGVSIYYNYLKNEQNRVKAKAIVVCIFALTFSIAFGFVVELVKYLASLIFASEFYSFGHVALNVLINVIGALAIDVVFYLSLKADKKVINACLIDIQND